MLNVATGHKTTIPFVPVSDFQHVSQEQNDAITKVHASGTRQRKKTLLIAHHYIQSLNENQNTAWVYKWISNYDLQTNSKKFPQNSFFWLQNVL